MLLWQILAVVLVLFFVVVGVLAMIEPGPLNRRSRNPRFRDPQDPTPIRRDRR
ncbi:MAG: hypothetical protein ABTQ73_03030 [Caldilineales bacterium]